MATIRLRNKNGVLELRSEGIRKKWKPCTVKVTSTYLLYFKDTKNLANPDGMILLNNVTKIEPHSARDAMYAFEVHFRNAKTSPSSPWILNANSVEDRIDWMEAIKPDSAAILKRIMSPDRYTISTVVPTDRKGSQGQSDKPLPNPRPDHTKTEAQPLTQARTLPHRNSAPSSGTQRREISPTQSLPLTIKNSSRNSSVSSIPSSEPQNYIEPSAFPEEIGTIDPSQSLPVSRLRQNGHPPPVASRKKNNTYSHKPRTGHPKLKSKTSSEKNLPVMGESEDHYVVMDASPEGELPPQTLPREKPKPKPRTKITPESSPSISREASNTSPEDSDILGDPDESDYLSIIDDRGPTFVSNSTAPSVPPRESVKRPSVPEAVPTNVAEQLMKNFNKDQLGELISMLQLVHVQTEAQSDEEIREAWHVPASNGPTSPQLSSPGLESSFRGSFKRLLSTAPDLSSEKMLVTDDDESYIPRPEWAKAVRDNTTKPPLAIDDMEPDTLSAMQEEALSILREDLEDMEAIGEGQFGKVYKGNLTRGLEKVQVAIKTTKKSSLEKQEEAFLKEMNIMSQLMHPNIVRLYGIVRKDVPAPWIVLEYLPNGDLKTFLSANKRPIPKLVKYMVDVSMGMHYLSEKGLVHRDLAARNVLVSENETCKVADFGLLREVPKDDSFYHMQTNVPCPVRWMPPESISDRNFSAASDVWSFGVLLWEIFNPTKTPYEKLGNIEVASKVMKGYRLPTPRTCPPVIARIMKACWHDKPEKRPSFLLISTLLTTKVSLPQEPE